jgi:hypothetical protein
MSKQYDVVEKLRRQELAQRRKDERESDRVNEDRRKAAAADAKRAQKEKA